MRQWVTDALDEVNSMELTLPDMPEDWRYALEPLVGRFPLDHGANCFAAALAGASGSPEMAMRIAPLWLHADPFLRSLTAFGYQHVGDIFDHREVSRARPLDVWVWWTGDSVPIHASFCVSGTHAFIKMGQSREQPWMVIPVAQIMDYAGCVSAGGHIRIYRKM